MGQCKHFCMQKVRCFYNSSRGVAELAQLRLLMSCHHNKRLHLRGGEAAVGADSSRPPPIYRPLNSYPRFIC